MLQLITVILIAFTSRFLIISNANTGFDTYGHLYFAKQVKEQDVGAFGEIVTRVVGSREFSHPFLWHWLISFFPIQKVLQFQKWINSGIDAVFAILIYFLALWINLDQKTAFLITLLYLSTPMWFSSLSLGPRITNLTPRLASELITNLFFIVTLLPLSLPTWLSLILGSLLSSFVVLSSKFGLQAILFFTPLISLLAWNFIPICALILGIILSISLTKGNFMKSVNTQLQHLVWYFKKNLTRDMAVSNRNVFSTFHKTKKLKQNFIMNLSKELILYNSYTSTVIKMPVLLTGFILYFWSFIHNIEQPNSSLIVPVSVAILLFFIINLPPLLFLGEAERYLNHVAFFIVTTTAILAINANLSWVVWIVIGYGFIYWFIESFFLHKILPSSLQVREDIDQNLILYLNSLEKSVVILSYPYHAVGVWRIMLETEHETIYPLTTSQEYAQKFEQLYADDYPYVKLEKLDEMTYQLGVQLVILLKEKLVSRGYQNWSPSSLWKKLDIGEPIYNVYQINSEDNSY